MKNNKSNTILIILLTFFITISLVLGGYIVYDKIINNNNNSSIDNNNIPNNNNEDNEIIKDFPALIDNTTAKRALQTYFNLTGAANGDPSIILQRLNLTEKYCDAVENNENITIFNINAMKTNIKSLDFKNEILKYMSENLYEENLSKYFVLKDYVYTLCGIGSGDLKEVASVKKINNNEYTATVKDPLDMGFTEYITITYKFTVINKNNTFIIDTVKAVE